MIVYKITSPTGKVYDNISNLKDFCEEYSLNFKGIRKRSYNQNGVKLYAGWQFRKYDDEFDVLNTDVHTDEMVCFNCGSTYEYSDNHYCSKCSHGLEKAKSDVKGKYIPDPSVKPEIPESIKKILEDFNEPPEKENNEEFKKYSQYGLTTDELLQKAIMENSNLKKKVKELTVENSLNKIVSGVIKENISFIPNYSPHITTSKKSKIVESAILLLSDIHADEIVNPISCGGLETYNFNVCCRRSEVLVDSVINFLINTMSNYHFENLYILLAGDIVHGDIHNNHNEFGNSIKASMMTGELISRMIVDFSKYFPKIKVHSINGNHGRLNTAIKKDMNGPLLNWDYLVSSYCASRLGGLIDDNQVEMSIPNSWSTLVEIYNYNIMLMHGDNIPSYGNIPFYGISRKTTRLNSLSTTMDKKINYYMMGHFHNNSSLTEVTSETIINGSYVGTDAYAYNALSLCNNPIQLLTSMNPDRGLTFRLPIHLRTKNWKEEEKEVGRYNIKLVGE